MLILLSFIVNSQNENSLLQDTAVVITAWTIDEYNNKSEASVDTSLEYFTEYRMANKKTFSNIYLGNIGLASQSNLYFLRGSSNFLFANASLLNFITNDEIKYYNTRRQYTNLGFYSNMSKKNNNQVLDIIHTQNVNEKLNFGLMYKMSGSTGEYAKQIVNNNDFAFFSSYDGEKYKYSANFIYNSVKNGNNGGIHQDYINTQNIKDNRIGLPVRLLESNSVITNREVNIIHGYDFSLNTKLDSLDTIPKIEPDKQLKLSHNFNYTFNRLKYYNGKNNYYKSFLVDSATTLDSTYANIIHNRISLDYIKKDSLVNQKYSVFVGNDFNQYSHDIYSNTYIESYAGLLYNRNKKGKYTLNLSFIYYVIPKSMGQYNFNTNYEKSLFNNKLEFKANFTHKKQTIDYFEEHYFSNNMAWDTSFAENKTLTDIDISLYHTKYKLYFGVYYGIYDNMIYFKDTNIYDYKVDITPFQETSTFDYLAIYIKKDFRYKHWIINNKLSYQKSGNSNVISIPDFVVYNSTTYTFNIKKGVLVGGIGYNLYYYSAYAADTYNPSTNMFYGQSTYEIGNYPRIDAFLDFKFKRARLFFLFEHANFGLMGEKYYAGIDYPMNPRLFKFGVSWGFYDYIKKKKQKNK